MIYEPRLLQMQGADYEAVVNYCEWAATKHLW